MRRRRCRSAGPTSRRPAARRAPSCSTAATPTAPPATGVGRRRAHVRRSPPPALGLRARRGPRVLDRPHRHPARSTPSRRASPRVVGRAGPTTAAADAADGDHDHRHRAEAGRRRRRRLHRRRHGQGRGDARARTWRRCSPCSPPTPPSTPDALQRQLAAAPSTTSFNRIVVDGCTSTNDTVLVLANGRAGAADPPQFAAAARRAPAVASPARWPTTPRAPPRSSRSRSTGAASDDEAGRGARKLAESQLVKCCFYGADPYWGRVVSELGQRRRRVRPRRRIDRLRRRRRVPGRRRRRRTTPAAVRRTWPAVTLAVTRPRPRRRRRRSSHQRPHPRLRRREHGDLVMRRPTPDARARRSSSRRCRTSGASAAATVVVKYGGNAMTDARAWRRSSPRTSCCCTPSASGRSSSTAAVRRSAR